MAPLGEHMNFDEMKAVEDRILAITEAEGVTPDSHDWAADVLAGLLIATTLDDYKFTPRTIQETIELSIAIAPASVRERAAEYLIRLRGGESE